NQTHFVDVNGEANKMFIWSSKLESDDGFRIESVAFDVPEPTTMMVFCFALIALVFRQKV
ncbi:MAG: PEP-CTERM sorting domain-containing protein, partial [Aliivibrio sp.]|nr:PEP-CTERM sorting domain-containing protein [Aliivibrio sp.]